MNMLIGYERTDGFDVVANAQQPDRDGFSGRNGQIGLNHAFNDAWSADFNAQGYDNLTETDDPYLSADQSRVQAFQYDGGLKFQKRDVDQPIRGQLWREQAEDLAGDSRGG